MDAAVVGVTVGRTRRVEELSSEACRDREEEVGMQFGAVQAMIVQEQRVADKARPWQQSDAGAVEWRTEVEGTGTAVVHLGSCLRVADATHRWSQKSTEALAEQKEAAHSLLLAEPGSRRLAAEQSRRQEVWEWTKSVERMEEERNEEGWMLIVAVVVAYQQVQRMVEREMA